MLDSSGGPVLRIHVPPTGVCGRGSGGATGNFLDSKRDKTKTGLKKIGLRVGVLQVRCCSALQPQQSCSAAVNLGLVALFPSAQCLYPCGDLVVESLVRSVTQRQMMALSFEE